MEKQGLQLSAPLDHRETLAKALDLMERYNIVKAFLSGRDPAVVQQWEVLVRHPRLRLFVENAGSPFRDDMIAVMTQYPQLYADVSTITWVVPRAAFYDHLEALVRAGLGKRLMFGSDRMRWPDKIGEGIEAIRQAPFLTEEQKRDILYHNAVRFLRLEDASD